jgi:Tol biopolymer transport system component
MKRFGISILLLMLFMSVSVAGARLLGQHLPTHYNCLRSKNVDLQLNRHLTIYRQRFYSYLAYPHYTRSFPSPDGRYQLIPSVNWERNTVAVLLKDLDTGLFTELSAAKGSSFDKRDIVGWSPDSHYVAYAEWTEDSGSSFLVYSLASHQLTRFETGDNNILSFSPDSQYLTLRSPSGGIMTISLRTFQPEFSVALPDLGYQLVWSPVGHRLALWSPNWETKKVALIDVDKKTHQLFTLLDLDSLHPWKEDRYRYRLHWSPDGHYVALHGDDSPWRTLPQFNPGSSYITVFSADGGAPLRFASRPYGSIDHPMVGWSDDGQLQYVTYDNRSSTSPYTSWAFDPKTNEHHLIASGAVPPVVESTAQAAGYGVNGFTANRDNQRLEIVDSETGNLYVFPEELNPTLPHDVFDPAVSLAVEVYPSPDGQTWLVSVDHGQSVYHVRPAKNRWKLVYQDGSKRLGSVLWSPDSQRVAFWRGPMMARNPHLMVVEAKDGKVWDLGNVGSFIWAMSWEQCGGVRTALFGDTTFGIGK